MTRAKNYQFKLLSALAIGCIGSCYSFSAMAQMPAAVEGSTQSAESTVFDPAVSDPAVSDPAVSDDSVTAEARIVLSLSQRQVSLFRGETLVDSYPVAVGSPETPTPQGQFTVSQMVIEPLWQSPWTGVLHEPGPDSALGLRWIGFTATSAGAFGFHGTPTVSSIGHAVSNGCVRMYNEDVVALFEQVTVGTPVIVTP